MQRYLNFNGDSGVTHYEIGSDYILIQFRSGKPYRYSYASAGRHHVEQMKVLATAGRGVSTYIGQHVRHLYES